MLDIGLSMIILKKAKQSGIRIRSLDNTPVKCNEYRSGHTRISLPAGYHPVEESFGINDIRIKAGTGSRSLQRRA